jgi:hypothetical protein
MIGSRKSSMWAKLQQLSGRQWLGATLLVVSMLLWMLIAVLPFLPLETTTKVSAGAAVLVAGEATFYAGLFLLGKEAVHGLRQAWQKGKGFLFG